MFSNRRPYYGLKLSISDLFREKVRYLKESNTQESMMEKPYLEDEYPKMHLKLPGFEYKPRGIHSLVGPIADSYPHPGLAMIDYGKAKCGWNITNTGHCTTGPVIITMSANYFWHAEFKFVVGITEDTVGVELVQLPETKARAWDEQDYLVTFPEYANGSVTICGFASTHTLVSQTFETVVAGMPVGIHLVGGAMLPIESGQAVPATVTKSVYGDKGDDCGCITLSSSCPPECECKTIGYTTLQMNVGDVQTLTVIDPDPGCTYVFSITSGGGFLTQLTDTSVNYTAPGINPECDDSPVITLYVDGIQCDQIGIAVNGYSDQSDTAYHANGTGCYAAVPNGGSLCGDFVCAQPYCWQCCVDKFSCDGSLILQTYSTNCWDHNPVPGCGVNWCNDFCSDTSIYDARTEEMIAQGCCPEGLL